MSSTRRVFLKAVVRGSTVVALAPGLLRSPAQAARVADEAEPANDKVLVVVQLSGGNDGLNTVVPYEDDAYGRHRRTLRLTANEVHKIESQLGFHPQLQALWQLYQEGHVGVVQGVGYPHNDRSHDGAMRDWHTAQPGDATCQTGWIGRAIDAAAEADGAAVPGIFVGSIPTPFALNAQRSVVPSIHPAAQYAVREMETAAGQSGTVRSPRRDLPAGAPAHQSLLDHVRRSSAQAHATTARIRHILDTSEGVNDYPPLQLAGLLQTIAQLIRAEVGTRIFFTELGGGGIGGFDNHAGQRDNHAALLSQLSESVAAFARDLQRDGTWNRVLLMTFSEFGRTLSENGRRGTGHGAAAPVLLAGGGLAGGLVGDHPGLSDLDQDAPQPHTDFRRVYATVLNGWLGFDSRTVLLGDYEPLDVFA
jgi:uncharacterized protein (DUF1501 family)